MTPPESPGGEPRGSGERPRTPEEEFANLYADLGGGYRAGDGGSAPPRSGPDLSALFVLLDLLRRSAPSELQERFTALIREALLTLRSLIDWYLDRLDNPVPEPRVEDIPID